MTRYQKKIISVFIVFIITFVGLLIYGVSNSERPSQINYRLNRVTPDLLNKILIVPSNPDWKINLTLDTITLVDKNEIRLITNELNNANDRYRGRGIRNTWEAILILDFKNQPDIRLNVVNSQKGICMIYTNTTGNPKYKCDGLKLIFESLADYKTPLGNRK